MFVRGGGGGGREVDKAGNSQTQGASYAHIHTPHATHTITLEPALHNVCFHTLSTTYICLHTVHGVFLQKLMSHKLQMLMSKKHLYNIYLSHLGFDDLLGALALQPAAVHLTVKVTDIAANGVVFHGHKVVRSDDVTAAGRRDKDVGSRHRTIHRRHLVPCVCACA